MRLTNGLIALCLSFVTFTSAWAEVIQIQAPAPAAALASCMYRALRTENPGQMKLTALDGAQELSRDAVGVGSSVFLWRAEVRDAGQRSSVVSAEITRPLIGPDQYEREIRQAVQACARS